MMRRYVFGDGSFILMGDEGTIIQGVLAQVEKHQRDVEQFLTKSKAEKEANSFEIKCVLSNREKGVFTVKWADGTVTMVTCQPGDDWDDEKALAMCFMKKALGNKGAFNDVMRDALKKMTVIPEKKKVVPAIAPAETKAQSEFSETMKKLQSHAAKAGKDMKEAISKLLNENNKTFKEKRHYDVYVVDKNKESLLGANLIKQDAIAMITKYRDLYYPELAKVGTPMRVWEREGNLCVDFGASRYIKISGMTAEDYLYN